RAPARLLGDFAPTIDVFVTSCGEDVDLIMDTLAAAASQDYPPHRYRVFALDDAQDRALARAVASFNSRQAKAGTAHVTYLSREKIPGKPHYFKAGNLQFGISESRKTGLTSEFVAGLDVDAIAEPDWLRRTVPHLILDGNLALINPVQAPYNLPENDVLGQGLAASGGWLDDLRDNMGLSSCYGSGYVMRRSALDSIGGWPRVSVGEDIMCGFLLTGNGWGIAACSDVLQHDLTPGSLDALVKQRMRWV
ncbi:glycosyltransferase family 2 protein, partial [Periconia macrospinosa]